MRHGFYLFFCLAYFNVLAQQDPFFMPFEGPVFKIPTEDMENWKFTYSDKVYDYEKIAEVSLQELKIPDRHVDIPFPGVERKSRYGMVLSSEMIIKQDGCYVFDLLSDDGSVFWIGEQRIVDNDGTHKYRRRTDTVYIDKGRYPVRIWYYQGFVHRYGLTFDGRFTDADCQKTATVLESSQPLKNQIELASSLLFDYDSDILKEQCKTQLDSIILRLSDNRPKSIKVIGHTCNSGSEKYNLRLSQRRADRIRDYFLDRLKSPGTIFRSVGLGSHSPKVPNDTDHSMSINRRVEIVIE